MRGLIIPHTVFIFSLLLSVSLALVQKAEATPTVERLVLVNAETDEDIRELRNQDQINLATLSTRKLNVRAETSGTLSEVVFNLNTHKRFRVESVAPYALAGDREGDYNSWVPKIGSNTISAVPFWGAVRGKPIELNFTVVNDSNNSVVLELESAAPIDSNENLDVASRSVPALAPIAQDGASTKRNFPLGLITDGQVEISKVSGDCLTIFNPDQKNLNVVCNHNLERPTEAVLLDASGEGDPRTICALGVPSSPVVHTCRLDESQVKAFHSGKMYVGITSENEMLRGWVQ